MAALSVLDVCASFEFLAPSISLPISRFDAVGFFNLERENSNDGCPF